MGHECFYVDATWAIGRENVPVADSWKFQNKQFLSEIWIVVKWPLGFHSGLDDTIIIDLVAKWLFSREFLFGMLH